LNLECYGAEFAAKVATVIDAKMKKARRITLEQMDRRAIGIRLRDGIARLLSPYL